MAMLALAGNACAREMNMSNAQGADGEIRPARDGNIAIREELEAARKAGTAAAYDLFIARHPDHPLAELARRERERLIAQQPQR